MTSLDSKESHNEILVQDTVENRTNVKPEKRKWGTTFSETDWIQLNRRLESDGFASLSDMLKAYRLGEFPRENKNIEITNFIQKLRKKDIKDPITGQIHLEFYKSVDKTAFKKYAMERYKDPYTGSSYFNYWMNYAQTFFTNTSLLVTEKPKKKEYIVTAMRLFGRWYDSYYNVPEVKTLIEEIIDKSEITRNMKPHNRLWIPNDGFVHKWTEFVANHYHKGETSTVIQMHLRTGIRGEEVDYLHYTPICDKNLCPCENLHVEEKPNGISLIFVFRAAGKKHLFFTLADTRLWKVFRALPKGSVNEKLRSYASGLLKSDTQGNVESGMMLRKLGYNTHARSEGFGEAGAEILAGHATTVGVKHYLANERNRLALNYEAAWAKYPIPEEILNV